MWGVVDVDEAADARTDIVAARRIARALDEDDVSEGIMAICSS